MLKQSFAIDDVITRKQKKLNGRLKNPMFYE